MGVGGQRHVPGTIPAGETQYHSIGGCVGPRVGLDGAENLAPARTRYPVSSVHSELIN